MDGIANLYIPAKIALDCTILRIQAVIFSGRDTSRSPAEVPPGARTQTPTSAWLASVPIVTVLRDNHCPPMDVLY